MRTLIFFLFCSSAAFAQYAPGVGVAGTTAMKSDSSAFVAWATGSHVQPGYQDISNASLGYANVGDSTSVIGIGGTSGIVSLGDGGNAIVRFLHPIINGPSWDFAVFENAFDDSFLELAFVEVSSDGINYYRFPASSLTDTSVQTGSFDSTDPTLINNLAGKYRAMYGTPFDLNEMTGISGLDVNAVHFVKIVDVVGSINPQYASYDTAGRAVNDPWPTAFGSGGFDLDAVGVIHHDPLAGIAENDLAIQLQVYPNPCPQSTVLNVNLNSADEVLLVRIYASDGRKVMESTTTQLNVSTLGKGIYVLEAETKNKNNIHKKISIQ